MLIKHSMVIVGLYILFSWMVLGNTNTQAQKPTIVIVHGAWGGSWAFRQVDSLLTERGYTVYRPSLTGLGERVHLATPDIDLSTHINDVVNMLLFEDLHDIILVGHSYGGMVITGVADRLPERIQRLIYLDAFVPRDGESLMSIQGPRGERLKQMVKDGFVVPSWVKPDQLPPKDVPHPLKTLTEPLVLNNKTASPIPTTYILTVEAGTNAKDDDFASQAKRAKEKGWPVHQLQADHNPQWSAPQALVEMLDQSP